MKTNQNPFISKAWAFLFAIGLTAAADAFGASLLINGSFETGPSLFDPASPDPGKYLPLNPGDARITGWVVTRASIDYVSSTFFQSADGLRSLDLDGTDGFGGIAQTFATVPGQPYHVTFAMAGNPSPSPTIKAMRVTAAGQFADFTFDTTGRNGQNMGWVGREWDFTATGTSTTLEFYSLDTIGGREGPTLDDVAVVMVPEPSVAALLFIGLLGAGLWRRAA